MAKKKRDTELNENGATLGFETKLFQAADKLRNNLDAAEYKHVVLGLIFLKYISDTFEEKHDSLLNYLPIPTVNTTSKRKLSVTRLPRIEMSI